MLYTILVSFLHEHSNVSGDSKNQIFVTCTSFIEGDNSGDNSNDDKDDSVNTDSHLG